MRVINDFRCRMTGHVYRTGDVYSGKRGEELKGLGYLKPDEGSPADEKETEWPKHLGFGKYELSNGELVKGKEDALKAQALLDE